MQWMTFRSYANTALIWHDINKRLCVCIQNNIKYVYVYINILSQF